MPPATASFPPGASRLHAEPNVDYQLQRFLGGEPAHELATLAARIDDYDGWTREMLAAADRMTAAGEQRRAAAYLRAAEFFVAPTDPRKRELYDRFVAAYWADRVGWARSSVPYEGSSLTVLHHARAEGNDAPAFLLFGGYESFVEELVELATPWVAAGFEVFAFDGPGQGEALHHRGLPMTAKWERPVAAVLDAIERHDVTAVGMSLGGYFAIRAAAFEPRIARVVAFDVMFDFFETFARKGGPLLRKAGRQVVGNLAGRALVDAVLRHRMERELLVDWGLRHAMFVTGTSTPAAALVAFRDYTTRDCSAAVQQDVLLLAGREDHHVPYHQLGHQLAALTAARSITTRTFTAHEHAGSHCQVGNIELATAVILDWTRGCLAADGARHSRAPG